jgi:GTPase SAR1 family protein
MFIKKAKPTVISPFFEGYNILNKGASSLYGKFVNAISNIIPNVTIDDEFNKSYKIPTVIVIGAESSGKSSLLENITKCPIFPRNNKICTKLPIILQLYPAQTNDDIVYSYTFRGDTIITDKNNISNQICDIMEGFDSNTIINEALTVVIKDIGLPHFNFVDLPGIRAYDEEMAKKTYDLSEHYIKQPDTIVLCVIPATIPRITSYNPIALIKKHNKMKDTLIALTMCDRVQEENIYDLIVQRITLESDEFQGMEFAGCTGVINRSNDTISLNNNGKLEMEWFDQNIISCIDESCDDTHIKNNLGVNVLINNIDIIYNKYINDIWIPKTIKNLENNINKAQKDIDALGEQFMKEEMFNYNALIRKIITLLLSKFNILYSAKNYEIIYTLDKSIPEVLIGYRWKIDKHTISDHINNCIKLFAKQCHERLEMYINNDFDVLQKNNAPVNTLKSNCYHNVIITDKKFNIKMIHRCLEKNNFVNKIVHDATGIIKLCQNELIHNKTMTWVYPKVHNDNVCNIITPIQQNGNSMLIACLYHNFALILKECLHDSFVKNEIRECDEDAAKRAELLTMIISLKIVINELTNINANNIN